MARKEVSIEDYTVDRKYTSHSTLEEFIRRMIRSHTDTDAPDPTAPQTIHDRKNSAP